MYGRLVENHAVDAQCLCSGHILILVVDKNDAARSDLHFFQHCMAISISITSLLSLRVVYNIYFHRLSRFPGPRYLAATDISLSILQLRGTSQYVIRRAHEKYGPIVRVAPRTLSFIESSAWNEIYGFKNGRAALPKDPEFYNDMLLPDITITRASDDDAVPIRRAMNSAFSHKALLEQEPMIQSHIKRLLAQLELSSYGNREVDVRKWITFSMFDINSDFGFGEDMGCVASGSFHEWVQFVVDFFYAATLIHQCYKFSPLNKLLALCIPKSTRERQVKHHEASLMRVRRRMSKQATRPDFMHHFVRSAEKEGLPTSVIEAQASIVILAGSETTAVAVTGAMYYILSNPRVYANLRKELQGICQTSADIRLRTILTQLPYLDAVVQETLRVHTPLANGFTRIVTDEAGLVISGHFVPRGTVVWINHYCCNTATQNFRDPLLFVPERWLGGKTYESDKREVVQPFSVGPRNCPGKMFALNNMKLLLTHLLWNFDMELCEGAKDWHVGQKVFNGWIQPALPIFLQKR
ncbi:cytochrome P450 [Lophiostoma macrostomum CBS 122681]|uniref:Cytochrome P450 n=1 Tax=Lophiostoma macrostomum CBS 122681 TaxID=1314788 RepID=A0A6A6SKH7_9PLEO|nr:cytochrome P450 [Lophiostoma macrostomum CBS 122681]